MYAAPWYHTVFSSCFPLKTVCRMWDVFLLEGPPVLFHFSMSLLKRCEPELLGRKELEVVDYIKSLPDTFLTPACIIVNDSREHNEDAKKGKASKGNKKRGK
eukprot:TRINITY_DN11380_c1_g5_i1.p1 TRINITY_DN11380_c1_g5~~TRINITY_DN11380_c1_g5_i1.p1  ORF type:complete len:102 (+),score=13.29 TRINITY_DN11380_c1_g5_i1:61-366(+)